MNDVERRWEQEEEAKFVEIVEQAQFTFLNKSFLRSAKQR